MAIIKKIRKVNKKINPTTDTIMDYNYDDDYFSIWTYKSGDLDGSSGVKQTLQLDRTFAKELIKILEEFIKS